MDYGNLLTKTWEIIKKNTYLIFLGVLVGLSSGGGGGGGGSRYAFSGDEFNGWGDMPQFDFTQPFQHTDFSWLAVGGIIALIVVLFLIGMVFWVVGTIARGGLISAVNDIEDGKTSSFGAAFAAGWKKGWSLIGITLIPAIPGLILFIVGVSTFFAFGGMDIITTGYWPSTGISTTWPVILVVLGCVLVPISLILSLAAVFAYRACMLEDLGVMSAFRRGFEVLGDNLGSILLLGLIQIAVSIGLGILLIIPAILMALCCLLWPLLILIEGAISAYFSTLWTLAWREFTLGSELTEVIPEA